MFQSPCGRASPLQWSPTISPPHHTSHSSHPTHPVQTAGVLPPSPRKPCNHVDLRCFIEADKLACPCRLLRVRVCWTGKWHLHCSINTSVKQGFNYFSLPVNCVPVLRLIQFNSIQHASLPWMSPQTLTLRSWVKMMRGNNNLENK